MRVYAVVFFFFSGFFFYFIFPGSNLKSTVSELFCFFLFGFPISFWDFKFVAFAYLYTILPVFIQLSRFLQLFFFVFFKVFYQVACASAQQT